MNQKIIIGTLVAVIIAGAVYFVIDRNSGQPINQPNPTPTPSPTLTQTTSPLQQGSIKPNSQGYLYTNDYYGFELQFPGSYEGLKVKLENDSTESSVKYIRFQVPKSKCTSSGDACYMNPVTAAIYPKTIWQVWSKESPYNQYNVKSNSSYTFSVVPWQEPGENTTAAKQIGTDISKVQSSLQVYNP
jgi:hypothetical protein